MSDSTQLSLTQLFGMQEAWDYALKVKKKPENSIVDSGESKNIEK